MLKYQIISLIVSPLLLLKSVIPSYTNSEIISAMKIYVILVLTVITIILALISQVLFEVTSSMVVY